MRLHTRIASPASLLNLIGWIPATIWAVYVLGAYKTNKKIEKALAQRG